MKLCLGTLMCHSNVVGKSYYANQSGFGPSPTVQDTVAKCYFSIRNVFDPIGTPKINHASYVQSPEKKGIDCLELVIF